MNKERYIRQTLLDKIGEIGQKKLLNSHVVVVGCGGLGSIAAPYLAGAGVGKLTLVDGDTPHVSNLHRQVFFNSESQNTTKSMVIAKHIQKLNPDVSLEVISEMLTKKNIESVLRSCDVVLECTDNIMSKYLVNDFCVISNIPLVYGAIHKYDGYVSFFSNKDNGSIHLRDIFPQPNENIPSCSEVGVMGTLAGIIGLLQANEAIKFLSGAGVSLEGKLLTYDILENDQMKLKLKKTFILDIQALYESANYETTLVCIIPEIEISFLRNKRTSFEVISILEQDEHQSIDSEVKHIPLSIIDKEVMSKEINTPTVFYCKSGRRSASLVSSLLELSPELDIYSLKGGIEAVFIQE